MLEQIKTWVAEHVRSSLESMFRVAVVSSTDPSRATVRVKVGDEDELISYDLRVVVRKAHKDFDYWMPDIGDQVLCVFLPFGLEQGFVLGSIYSKQDKVPVESQDKWHVLFKDGTWLEYDRKEHAAIIDMTKPAGSLTIRTGSTEIIVQPDHVYIRSDKIDLNDDR